MLTGTVAKNPIDDTKLIFNLDTDTLPTNTLEALTKIVNPRSNYPGDGTLDAATTGQRYLITEDLDADAWPNWGIDASANDILEYDGTKWTIDFDASNKVAGDFILNNYTNKQFKWDGTNWISSYEGVYNPGFWRLVL